MSNYRRELSVGGVLVLLLIIVGSSAPRFFDPGNLLNLLLENSIVLIAAIGMTAIILTGEIDLSIGAVLAMVSYGVGLAAKAGVPALLLFPAAIAAGALLGAVNGWLVVPGSIRSMIATLATLTALRGLLALATQGRWVLGLPASFQWFGLGQTGGQVFIIATALVTFGVAVWAMRALAAGRALYAVGADQEAARLVGIRPAAVRFWTFVTMGGLMGVAAFLQSIRFRDVQSGAAQGLEMQVIACVVVGGTAITGGRGSLWGTLLGVALLGVISTILTFENINPAWAKAIQGAIILLAVASDAAPRKVVRRA